MVWIAASIWIVSVAAVFYTGRDSPLAGSTFALNVPV
jgi:hypothetical protein